MPTDEDIKNALRLIKSAQELLEGKTSSNLDNSEAKAYEAGEQQIVEGVFDGQNMIGPNEKIFPIPANYASKSKLVEGDRLKLTIMPNGSLLYKQISPIDRDFIKGTLIQDDGHYKVVTDEQTYRVLLASVTYYKGSTGDELTIIVPKGGNSIWAAIEAIIPKLGAVAPSLDDSF